ncbi:glycoside hydrolase family 43 protein [Sphingomonas echinoides]|uniref:glycoside hydrolase family 43 protein n=1 Tax=Sphingomonas echinoides TaxID=59803 RepID=UPI00241319F2|nr:glycoside hydrolase 43 family protein [Sphingomonas echinoides]
MKWCWLASVALALPFAAPLDAAPQQPRSAATWTADNGNGTYTNPLFFDEFSDPDMIRVGDDFYLTGTTMHAMPGLPILHSRDLVNWDFVTYALDTLDLGSAYRLEKGENVYGRGIWAPSFRYHAGTFYIFSNVNGQTTQMLTAPAPRGPWKRTPMKRSFHDLSVLFDDDGKTYVIWGYQEIHLAQLDATLTDIVPGSERIIIPKGSGMGEGSHFFKMNGKYFITSAEYAGPFRMPAARSSSPLGPYEINPSISQWEDFGELQGYRVKDARADPLVLTPPNPKARGGLSLHQGGVIQTPKGDTWGWSMFEGNSVGRLTALSPVTWKDGWPYFGLPGNLGRTPRTWIKPDLPQTPDRAPYVRSDPFDGPGLRPVWQWNHVPVPAAWSLSERKGALRLHALPATGFLQARNTLTQRAIGPQSSPTVELDASGLKVGDVAGLGLLNRPYSWFGVRRDESALFLVQTDEIGGEKARVRLETGHIWLRTDADFTTETARYSYSLDGRSFTPIGAPVQMAFQLITFQGVRYGLFAYHQGGTPGGQADFLSYTLAERRSESRPAIPYNRTVRFMPVGTRETPALLQGGVRVVDHGLGRVGLEQGNRALTALPDGSVAWQPKRADRDPTQSFQWMESLSGGALLMALSTNRYLHQTDTGTLRADSPGATADNADRSRWNVR